jgi:hypothetical protein
METTGYLFLALPITAVLVLIAVFGSSAAWLVNDSLERGYSGIMPFVLLRFFGPFGALIWLFVRPRTKLVERTIDDYANADDALDAASKLDLLGYWEEAIALYRHAAERWPEHGSYIQECIKALEGKRASVEP